MGWEDSRTVPMEVNMPLFMLMLLDWNPTGPGKEDRNTVSALCVTNLEVSRRWEEQVTGGRLPGYVWKHLSHLEPAYSR